MQVATRTTCPGEQARQTSKQSSANAIVNVRFTTSSVAGGAAELYSYGTAVTVA